ncbi:hypothetical protein L195_g004974 [Trifolium pratense]|uniref:Uncharacterized protein n=1 Tax=Trifolium pratense TaxID=57577 RepID=A0A2K3NZJ7_TRIPR|nr:hypothetical protein L195_g004974 [Trifolium pratense]
MLVDKGSLMVNFQCTNVEGEKMEGEEGGGVRLSKRFNDDKGGGEVDYKAKSGTAWRHNFLNQNSWHPFVYAQEQEFYRQTALFSKKDKEKVELMQAVSLCRHMEKKKPRPKDVFGCALPTEEEFEVFKNAPSISLFEIAIVEPNLTPWVPRMRGQITFVGLPLQVGERGESLCRLCATDNNTHVWQFQR